jgi:hypothetical protein
LQDGLIAVAAVTARRGRLPQECFAGRETVGAVFGRRRQRRRRRRQVEADRDAARVALRDVQEFGDAGRVDEQHVKLSQLGFVRSERHLASPRNLDPKNFSPPTSRRPCGFFFFEAPLHECDRRARTHTHTHTRTASGRQFARLKKKKSRVDERRDHSVDRNRARKIGTTDRAADGQRREGKSWK